MKIATRLVVGFGVCLAFLLLLGAIGVHQVRDIALKGDKAIEGDAQLLEYAQLLRVDMNAMRRLEKDVLLSMTDSSKVASYHKEWKESRDLAQKHLDILEKMETEPKEKEQIASMKRELAAYDSGFQGVISQIGAGAVSFQQAAKSLDELKGHVRQAEKTASDYAATNESTLAGVKKELDRGLTRTIVFMVSVVLLSFLLGLTLVTFLIRSIKRPLDQIQSLVKEITNGDLTQRLSYQGRDELGAICGDVNLFVERLQGIIGEVAQSAVQVSSASNELHSTAEQIATGAEEVASQTGAVATASEEMSTTSGDIAQNCLSAAATSNEASDAARNGAGVVQGTIEGMTCIAARVTDAAKTVEELGTRSDQIGAIIGTIEDIADQTNLLALNAAIEAARAGEQGRGFAVVADEVRALAERTTRATREIDEMIKAIQLETKGAVAAMGEGVSEVEKGTAFTIQSGEALDMILAQINDVTSQVNQIATAAEQQTATTREITNNIAQISDVVQATAKGASETAAASARLASEADHLQQLVGQFKL